MMYATRYGLLLAILALLAPVTVRAGTDEYKGDSAIYYGLPVDSQKPNILFVIDNSKSTKNSAPIIDYAPFKEDKVTPFEYPKRDGCKESDTTKKCYLPWYVYEIDNQGDVANNTVIGNNSFDLESIKFTNNSDVARKTLQISGTYTSAGNDMYPGIGRRGEPLIGSIASDVGKTVYVLGNYLNYLNNSDLFGTDSQRKVMYDALEKTLGSAIGSANFAAMVFGANNKGGKLIKKMTDLSEGGSVTLNLEADSPAASFCSQDTNADRELCKFLAALPGSGKVNEAPLNDSNAVRSQAEAVFDAGYYYGASYENITIEKNLRIEDSIKNECDYNHIILLTNGLTNTDNNPKMSIVGDADNDRWPGESTNMGRWGHGSHRLDDVAAYLFNVYKIKTHTVLAFQQDDVLVKNAAEDGRGNYYRASNADELAAALGDLLDSVVLPIPTSFVAPVVPASTTNRTVSGNKVYLGLFRPQDNEPWRGNVKKYTLGLYNQLLDADGKVATDAFGSFYGNSVSYWSRRSDDKISSSNGDIDTNKTTDNSLVGDGGVVDAGGVGGSLLYKVQGLAALVREANSWTGQPNMPWRKIYAVIPDDLTKIPAGGIDLNDKTGRHLFTLNNVNVLFPSLGVDNVDKARDLICYVHGFTGYTAPSDASARRWVFGDVLHSRPLVMSYNRYGPSEDADCAKNNSIIYVGANDGMLHAFKDCDGSELWGFIPPDSLSSLQYIKNPRKAHATFVDSPPSAYVYDQNNDGIIDSAIDKVVLMFGLRRGGGSNNPAEREQGAYYALDVTKPESPKLLWRTGYKENDAMDEIAQTWSQPRQAKIKIDDNNFKVVMFVGAGYDTNEDTRFGSNQKFLCGSSTDDTFCVNTDDAPIGGTLNGLDENHNIFKQTSLGDIEPDSRLSPRGRGIYAIEVADMLREAPDAVFKPSDDSSGAGSIYWSYRPVNNSNLDYAFAGDLAVLDSNNDGYADLLYGADTGGNLWRFDLGASDKKNWSGEIIFRSNLGSDGTNGRKIFYRPIVANIGGAPHIYFGTGDREHPLNLAVTDRIYCIIDWKAVDSSLTYPIDESLLEDVTDNLIQKADTDSATVTAIYQRLYSRPDLPYDDSESFRYGWYIKLDGGDRKIGGDPGEKVTAPATVFNGQVFFTTYQPDIGKSADCQPGNMGKSRLYHLDYKTGEAVYNYDLTNDLNSVDGSINERAVAGPDGALLQRADRVRTLGEGIPSGVVTLLDASGKVTLLISSSDKVEASSLPDVKLIMPVYWMQW
jgi:type IV pilus assembly protein PilY1